MPLPIKSGVHSSVLPPPLPNRPLLSFPQQLRLPSSRSAHVCSNPADMATAVRPVSRLMAVDEGAYSATVPDHILASPLSHFTATAVPYSCRWLSRPRCRGVSCSTIAQLSFVVPAPRFQIAVVKNAGVVTSSRHRNGRAAGAEVDGRG